jgi:hypothetical protein
MKTKAILATLLIAATAGADARFAWPYPPKAVSPDEIGHWVVINGNAWPDSAAAELTFTKQWSTIQIFQNDPRFKVLTENSAAPASYSP